MDKRLTKDYQHSVKLYDNEFNIYSVFPPINMAEYSGYARVAYRACNDIRRKDYLRRISENDSEFKKAWKMECRRKEEKLRAIQDGLWKTQMSRVTSATSDVPFGQTVKKGRFLITVCNDNIKKEDRKPTVVRKGRFLVTKHYVHNKPPVKPTKPVVTRKGRFLITVF